MDPITHGLSGAVIARSLPRPALAWWFPIWAALAAMSPDVDVFFINTPLEYIKYHRGITHSFAGGWALAFLWALVLAPLSRLRVRPREFGEPDGPAPWSLIGAWCMAYLLILHHIWLDCMNSYGTQVFLPFSDYRVRLNALFIVDPLLMLPLLAGLIWKYRSRMAMICLLLWTILYPLASLGVRAMLEDHLASEIRIADVSEGVGVIRPQPALFLVPDAFTPLHWKVIESNGNEWKVGSYNLGQGLPTPYATYAKPELKMWRKLGELDETFRAYQRFAAFPALEEVIPLPDGNTEYVFSDLRFGSTIGFVNDVQSFRDGKPITFRIMARFTPEGALNAVRLITTTGAGGDSGWQPPDAD